MKLSAPLAALALSLFLTAPLLAGAGQFVAVVSGTRKFQSAKNGNNVIGSEAVSAKSLCTAFGVSTKDYAVVFDANVYSLSLVPLKAMPAKPTYQILAQGTFLNSYTSASPSEFLVCADLTAGADAGGTEFAGMTGLETFTIKTKMGSQTGAVGTFTGVATTAAADSFFTIKVSAAKPFVQH